MRRFMDLLRNEDGGVLEISSHLGEGTGLLYNGDPV